MTTAAIYARVSSARQKEEQTIASQTAALRAHADAIGFQVPPEWVFEDEGYSGATLIRPALERLRDLAAEIEIPVVLCYTPDRLARRYVYQTLLIEEFARVGTEVRFLKGRKSETPEDELLLQFQGMIAEYERAQIAERTRRGKVHRARAGSPAVLCGAPYGYRYVRRSEEADARYEIVEPEATVVRELFRRYVEDQDSIAGLVRWLSTQGIPTATGKSRWDRSTLWGMLRNPAYCGRAAFGKTRTTSDRPKVTRPVRRRGVRVSGNFVTRDCARDEWVEIPVSPIVSEEVFELAARRLEDNKRFASRRTKEPSLLQGLVACHGCGYSYYRVSTRTRKRKLYYYRCLGSDDYRYEQGRVCDNPPVRQDYLDELVWNHVTALMADPELIRAELDRRLHELQATSPIAAQNAQLERELRRTERAIHRLVEAYQEELITLDELRRRTPELRKKAAALRAQLKALEAQALDRETYLQLAENLEGFLVRLRSAAESSSIAERQRVLRLLVKEVLVGPERVVIRHSIPSPRGDPGPGYRLCRRSHHSALGNPSLPRGSQDQPQQMQHLAVTYSPRNLPQQDVVSDGVEVGAKVEINDVRVALQYRLGSPFDRLMRCLLRPVAKRPRLKVSLEDRFQDQLEGSLDHPVTNGGNRKIANSSALLRYSHLAYPQRTVRTPDKLLAELFHELIHSLCLDCLERHPVNPWSAVVLLGQPVSRKKRLALADVPVQPPEAPRRFSLRLDVYPSSQILQTYGCLCHLTPASPIDEEFTCSRAPWLHGRYPASKLLQTQPPPSRLRPTSRELRLYDLPCSTDFSMGRGRLLQLLSASLSPCCPYHPAGATRRLSQLAARHDAFARH
jgi:site-specific DNA recombinase